MALLSSSFSPGSGASSLPALLVAAVVAVVVVALVQAVVRAGRREASIGWPSTGGRTLDEPTGQQVSGRGDPPSAAHP